MKLQSLVLTALLLNISLVHAVKITLVNKTGEAQLALSPCPEKNCANYKHADLYNLPSTIAQFSGSYEIDSNSSMFKQYPLITVHTIGEKQLAIEINVTSYKKDTKILIGQDHKGGWFGDMPELTITEQ